MVAVLNAAALGLMRMLRIPEPDQRFALYTSAELAIVTMDDVIAEVMDDEVHSSDSAPVRHDDGSLSLDGEVTLAELEDDHGIILTNPEVTTIAGIVLAATSILPKVGTTATVHAHDLTVEAMSGRKITRIRIRPIDEMKAAPDSGDPVAW